MDFGALLILLGLLIMISGYIALPILGKRSDQAVAPAARYSELLAERDRILDAIQELDFDHAMGKVETDAYGYQRAGLVERGASILRTLDRWHESMNGPGQLPVAPPATEAEAETSTQAAAEGTVSPNDRPDADPGASAAVLTKEIRQATMDIEDEIEKLITARRQANDGKSVGFCHQCGHVLHEQDRFCASCGAEHQKGT